MFPYFRHETVQQTPKTNNKIRIQQFKEVIKTSQINNPTYNVSESLFGIEKCRIIHQSQIGLHLLTDFIQHFKV